MGSNGSVSPRTDVETAQAWFTYASSLMPGLGEWFARKPERALTGLDRVGIVRGWARIFGQAGASLGELKDATDTLVQGDDPPRPSELGLAVARLVRRRRGAQSRRSVVGPNGEPTVACRSCLDQGLIQVVHPCDLAAAERGDDGLPHRSAVACRDCARGRAIGDHVRPMADGDVRWSELADFARTASGASGGFRRVDLQLLAELLAERYGGLAAGEATVGRFAELDGGAA